jgi:hypothetical protein
MLMAIFATVLMMSAAMPALTKLAFAASSGPNNGGTIVNDNTVGTIA